MPVIELDMLIALVNISDELHRVADLLFKMIVEGKLRGVRIATSALLEYELVLRSRGYQEREVRKDIEAFSRIRNLGEQPLTAETVILASRMREKYGLSYFDSLHCASAVLYDGKLLSVDEAYDSVPEVARVDPRSLVEGGSVKTAPNEGK